MNISLVKLPETVSVALLVLAGEYGNDSARINALKKDGYNPTKVQNCVNDLCDIIERYK